MTQASSGPHSMSSYLKAFKADHSLRSTSAGNSRATQCNHSPAVKCHQHPLLLAEGVGAELKDGESNSTAKAPAESTWQPCHRADNSTTCIHPKLHPHRCGTHNTTVILLQQQQEALIVPQRIVVRASRSALQRYLDSPEFADVAAAAFPDSGTVPLGANSSGGNPNQGQEPAASPSQQVALGNQQQQQEQGQQGRRWGPTHSSGRPVTKGAAQDTSATILGLLGSNNSSTTTTSSTGSSSSSSWRRGILVVAGGRPLLTQLAVQLKVR